MPSAPAARARSTSCRALVQDTLELTHGQPPPPVEGDEQRRGGGSASGSSGPASRSASCRTSAGRRHRLTAEDQSPTLRGERLGALAVARHRRLRTRHGAFGELQGVGPRPPPRIQRRGTRLRAGVRLAVDHTLAVWPASSSSRVAAETTSPDHNTISPRRRAARARSAGLRCAVRGSSRSSLMRGRSARRPRPPRRRHRCGGLAPRGHARAPPPAPAHWRPTRNRGGRPRRQRLAPVRPRPARPCRPWQPRGARPCASPDNAAASARRADRPALRSPPPAR